MIKKQEASGDDNKYPNDVGYVRSGKEIHKYLFTNQINRHAAL